MHYYCAYEDTRCIELLKHRVMTAYNIIVRDCESGCSTSALVLLMGVFPTVSTDYKLQIRFARHAAAVRPIASVFRASEY